MSSISDTIDQTCLKFYYSLPKKPDTTIRFFKRGMEFHTLYGEDAKLIACEVLNMPSLLRSFNENADTRVMYLNVNDHRYEMVMRKLLLVLHYRVEVYTSDTKKLWKLDIKASPGYLYQVEDILYSGNQQSSDNATIISVKTSQVNGQTVIGMSMIDTGTCQIKLSQFVDTDQFSNLQSLLVQLDVGECLVPTGSSDLLISIMKVANVLVTECKKSDFSVANIEQDLRRVLPEKSLGDILAAQTNANVALYSLAALFKYLEIFSDEEKTGNYCLQMLKSNEYMRLDHSVVESIALLPSRNSSKGGNKYSTVYGLLNHCQTTGGKRLLSQWIRQPLLDINKINERLDMVETFTDNHELCAMLFEGHLPKIPDFRSLARRFTKKTASLQDCYSVYTAIRALPALIEDLKTTEGSPHATLVAHLLTDPLQAIIDFSTTKACFNGQNLLSDFNKFCEMVESTIDFQKIEDNREYVINASFDDDLLEISNSLDLVEKDIKVLFKKAAKDLSLEPNKIIKLDSNAQIGYFYRITRKEEKVLRTNKKYSIVDTSKACVRFTESRLDRLNVTVLDLKASYREQQSTLVTQVMSIAAGYIESIEAIASLTSKLDVFVSLSHMISKAPATYVRPKLLPSGEGILILDGLRHCCLEVQDNISYIANDARFSKDKDCFQIITGPNMGGKSTYIRSVALAVLLAQIGCYVPADNAEISLVDALLTRIGAGDVQSKGVSTFMAEMLDTASILKSATKNSLIIIDELGRGSSTYDGFGLAWAISDHIISEIGCFTMFATHFHELTALSGQYVKVGNFHVMAITTDDSLTLLYKVQRGICDRSFGLHVAKLTHFPEHVIQYAKMKADEMEDFYSGNLQEKLEGEEMIKKFIEDFESLKDNDESIQKLKDEILAKGNAYIKSLCPRIG